MKSSTQWEVSPEQIADYEKAENAILFEMLKAESKNFWVSRERFLKSLSKTSAVYRRLCKAGSIDHYTIRHYHPGPVMARRYARHKYPHLFI
jgi:hypothetical protein